MRVEREVSVVPMTAADVLAVFRDEYRFAERLDPEAEPGIDLRGVSTVAEWRSACDLLGDRRLGQVFNRQFGIAATDTEWRAVLSPPKQATLGAVCEFIAAKGGTRPVPCVARLAGSQCEAAGAFLTLRALVALEGGRAHTLRPSTSLGTLPLTDVFALITAMSRLAPGVAPVPRLLVSRAERVSTAAAALAALAVFIGIALRHEVLATAGGIGFVAALMAAAASSRIWPTRAEFEEPTTLGGLARRILTFHVPPT